MVFEVGDRVRIHDCEGDLKYNGMIGIVKTADEMLRTGHARWNYLCVFDNASPYPFGPKEMDKLFEKGEQLLFSFMEQENG